MILYKNNFLTIEEFAEFMTISREELDVNFFP